jgi:hypothetical protein
LWVAVDGGYARKPLGRPAAEGGRVVRSRLRKDAALKSVPKPRRPGRRGRPRTYGEHRISLAQRAGPKPGWQPVECSPHGFRVTRQVNRFLATGRPAGGPIVVVLVQEEDEWRAYFCLDTEATAAEVLEALADRSAIEQTNRDVKEGWGAGPRQVRNLFSDVGCFNLNLWMYSLIEVGAWDKEEGRSVGRSRCPWDNEPRRPSPRDRRKALQREVLREEITRALAGRPAREKMRALAERLLELAA